MWSKLWPTERGQTHRHTPHALTDKKVKTEGPKILSNDIFYFRTVIIGGPINYKHKNIESQYMYIHNNKYDILTKQKSPDDTENGKCV